MALDRPDSASALRLVDQLEGQALWYKVGLELYLAEGQAVVHTLRARDFQVFLDLKLHDIPNTVAAAVRSVASCGASLLTIHAAGGSAMLRAAVEAAAALGADAPELLAVTVLTSLGSMDLESMGCAGPPETQVLRLGRLALQAGVAGLVASPAELPALRSELGRSPMLVIPGVRPAGSLQDDQSRTATPAQALQRGASMLVVGRPITAAADPARAAAAILFEMQAAGPAADLPPAARQDRAYRGL